MSVDYKATVFLPRTDFPMRAGLPKREPEVLARWMEMDLYARQRAAAKGRDKFILHDGPPYANGHLHMGHALNKVLKDVVNRSQQMLGKDANYVPGWDCHGLPIEWKVEEGYRARGQDKDSVPINEFRRECRDFAQHWIKVQTEEFQRLGVIGDWRRPYTTMAFAAEAQIVRELGKFLLNGGLYQGSKPVLWSVPERTALADAEVEYHDHTSTVIWVRFPVAEAPRKDLDGASIVIWTTTPWTIPGNRAIAFGADETYAVLTVDAVAEGSGAVAGERVVVASALADAFARDAKIADYRVEAELAGGDLAGTLCAHPLRGQGYDFDVPLHAGDFVDVESGTGFVHIAPGHGTDDYELGLRERLEVPQTVGADGRFLPHVPLFAGTAVLTDAGKEGDANRAVVDALGAAGRLVARGRLKHSYPHSWRSKAPLIFRNTPQWFISMETNGLRTKALAAIDATRFVPAPGRARLRGMIETRPDWCVSRQRLWGVPLPLFVEKKTGEPLRDPEVIERIAQAFAAEGGDAWFDSDPRRFLGDAYDPEDYEQGSDIVEVWFDSGSTHAYVLEARDDLDWPADLYLEGSDQHRGWFHSSLLESAGTRGRAPFEAVLTHGFVLDEQARKMSKSLGNVTAPQEVIAQHGADVLRLWVVASNYEEDLRIGPEILRYQVDAYRRLRNTLRYLLGNLSDFRSEERIAPAEMPELERWVLHRLAELDGVVRRGCADFDFHSIYQALHTFCAVDLSAFYFDVRKDSLYCDRPDSVRRRACRTVLDHLFECLTAWLAPILCFTAEEAWLARGTGEAESVHLRLFPEVPASWRDDDLAMTWTQARAVRRAVTGALEIARAEKRIGSSLQAHPTVYINHPALFQAVSELDMAEIAITSDLTLIEGPAPKDAFTLEAASGGYGVPIGSTGEGYGGMIGSVSGAGPDVIEHELDAEVAASCDVGVVIAPADGDKCQRCWRILPEVGQSAAAPETCRRCADAVQHLRQAAQ